MGVMTPQRDATQTDPDHDTAARLLGEGTMPLVEAAREAGLRPVPSLRTLLRASITGRLESLRVAGRRVTSVPAVVRWVAAQQRRRAARPAARAVDSDAVLSRYGLGREQEAK